jgi:hypothetical protein
MTFSEIQLAAQEFYKCWKLELVHQLRMLSVFCTKFHLSSLQVFQLSLTVEQCIWLAVVWKGQAEANTFLNPSKIL